MRASPCLLVPPPAILNAGGYYAGEADLRLSGVLDGGLRTRLGLALLGVGAACLLAAGAFYAYTAFGARDLDKLVVTGEDPPRLVDAGGESLYPGIVTPYRQWADPRGTLDLGQGPWLEGFTALEAVGQPSFHGEASLADRIIIPALGIDAIVENLEIVDLGDSRAYETPRSVVGHIPGTPNAGSHGNGWYFGHLESPLQGEGNVFRRLPRVPELLRDGEDIYVVLQSNESQYLYRVTETNLLHGDDLRLYQAGEARITLVTCQPRGRYDHRLLVTALLVGVRDTPPSQLPSPVVS